MRIQSPESDEDNENPRPPAKKATKASTTRKKSSNDGIEADNIVEGRRNGRSSMKQAENDQGKQDALEKRTEKQRKKIDQLQRQLNQLKSTATSYDPIGSEALDEALEIESEDDGLPLIGGQDATFASQGVFKAKPLPRNSAPKPPVIGRKTTSAASNDSHLRLPSRRQQSPNHSRSRSRARRLRSRSHSPDSHHYLQSSRDVPMDVRGRSQDRRAVSIEAPPRACSTSSVISVVSLPPASPRGSSSSSRPPTPSTSVDVDSLDSSLARRPGLELIPSRPLTSTTSARNRTHAEGLVRRRSRSHSREREREHSHKRHRAHSPQRASQRVLRFKEGRQPKDGHTPSASDFEKSIEVLINTAVDRFHLKIFTIHAYPSLTLATEWAQETWLTTCKDSDCHFSADDTAYIARVIVRRASSGRSHFKGHLNQRLHTAFNLEVGAPDGSSRLAANLKKLAHLRGGSPPRFCFKDWEENDPARYAETSLLAQVVQSESFKDSNDVGMSFHTMFNPIPLPLIALFMTCMHCCLDAWSTGRFDKEHKMSKIYISKYDEYMKDVNDWRNEDPGVVDKLREKMFMRVLALGNIRIAGIKGDDSRHRELVKKRFATVLKGRTGDTDSE